MLRRGESQVGAITKLVWMRLAPHIGEAIEIVTTAMVAVFVATRIPSSRSVTGAKPGKLQRRVPPDATDQRCN